MWMDCWGGNDKISMSIQTCCLSIVSVENSIEKSFGVHSWTVFSEPLAFHRLLTIDLGS